MTSGDRLGHLTLICEAIRTPRRQRQWLCRCECGYEVVKREDRLQDHQGLSCGRCQFSEFGTRCRTRPLTIDGQALAVTWHPWALARARSWQRRWPGLEDEIESAAQYGLVLGVSRFELDRSPDLEKFLLWSVLTTVRKAIRNERRRMATPRRLVLLLVSYTGIKISPYIPDDHLS